MLQALAIGAALAAAPTPVDLPKLFAEQLPEVTARTEIAVLLPQRMPTDAGRLVPTGFGQRREWGLQIAAVRGCGATACFIASFAGRRGSVRPTGRRTVRLIRGRTAKFTPLSCGASCAPPRIEWRDRGALYTIEASVGTRRTERRILVRMANSAIHNGPR
jgi:hypothetical protein